MSIGFNWFKKYKIEIKHHGMCVGDEIKLYYIDGGSTSHSGHNIGKCQDLLEKYTGKRIPKICEYWIQSEDEKLELIEPSEMSIMCQKVLDNYDCGDMRERIERFKELSDKGYYLSYDC